MKKIIIIAGIILLLSGGALGGLFATGNLALIGLGGGEAPSKAAKKMTVLPGDAPSFIPIRQMVVPVLRNDRIAFQVYLEMQLEVANARDRIDVRKMLPKIQDAIVTALVTRPVMTNDGTGNIDILAIKSRVMKAIRKVPNGNLVQNVLILQAMRGK